MVTPAEKKGGLLHPSTIQLLRFPFSLFLMPVYWFALSQVNEPDWGRALLIFFILHALVYPASNGYNSYMDRDTGPIGGVQNPLQPTAQLFRVSVLLDIVAVALSLWVSWYFAGALLAYILASRAYSFRGIRLKKYPVAGYLVVTIFQGAVTFFMVWHGAGRNLDLNAPAEAMMASSLLIGGFYPLTQVYQHDEDLKDGVKTLSYLLGKKGTFLYSGIVYALATGLLAWYFFSTLQEIQFLVLMGCMLPILIYFNRWFARVRKDAAAASYGNLMRMNLLASVCTNSAFIIILIMNNFE